ncbi:MAG: xanthine dehydrogenase molybdopterin binding subunit [Hyphomicrobiaceae bacterium]
MTTQQNPKNSTVVNGGLGFATRHDSAEKHVCGDAIYVDDMPEPPGLLHVQIAQAQVAHARLKSLDVRPVREQPGVVAVATASDIPGQNDVSPIAGDDPLFAVDLIQYWGQSLFAVAAETREEARRAAKFASVGIETLAPILTIETAMQARSFLTEPYTMTVGDAAAAIARAPHHLSGRICIGGQEHFYLEGQAAMAVPGEDDDITVFASSQHPSEIQHKVAHVLGIKNHSVNIVVRRMGGAFGGKESQGNLPACAAAVMARLTGRPTKVVYDRDDDITITGKRHDFRIDYRVGFDRDGRILGVEFDQAMRCGMSWDLSEPIGDRAMLHADNCYYLPNARITSYRCKTHTQSNTAFRGFGGPQGMLGIERVMDHVAFHLKCDPLAVRRANFYDHRDRPHNRGTTHYNMAVEDCIIDDIVNDLEEQSNYQDRRREINLWNARHPYLKRGLALTPVKFGISFTKTFLNQAGALLHVYTDGSIALNHGGTEMGQGLFIKVAQVVAEEFQVDVARVKITATTTEKVPNTSATAASSGSDLNGMAARNAARTIKCRLIDFLSELYQAPRESVTFLPGIVRVGAAELTFEDVIQKAYIARISLSATGFYATPKITWDRQKGRGRPFFYFSYGAAVTEAIVDTLTGENRLLRVDILHDVGNSLNPAIDLGQIEGGYVQGAGWLMTEELVWDTDGRLTTHAPSTYKIPTAGDRPQDMRINIFSDGGNTQETIYKSKAVGEPPLMLGISALLALSDAIGAVKASERYPALDAPATPERVLMAIEALRRGQT